MAELTIDYNAGTQEGSAHAWTNISNAWDSNIGTKASISVLFLGNSNKLVATGHDDSNILLSDITKVEIGVNGTYSGILSTNRLYGRFNGSTDSAGYVSMTLSAPVQTYWLDLTNDANGPGTGNWTWSDIDNLDCYFYGNAGLVACMYDVYQFFIRVTYNSGKINGIDTANIAKINGIAVANIKSINGVE